MVNSCILHTNRVIPKWWEKILDQKTRNSLEVRAIQRARAQFSFHCSRCHRASSLFVEGHEPSISPDSILDMTKKELSQDQLVSYHESKSAYIQGEQTEMFFFSVIQELFPVAKEGVMNAILLEISDIERRATLQGRYLRAYPKISAPCCKYLKETLGETLDHCFQCSVKWIGSGHEGLTCVQFRASKATQDSIVPCPECGMNLVKGDGCNSVKCVCGHKFNWQQAAVRATRELAKAYERSHLNAASECALELYDLCSSSSHIDMKPSAQAVAWANNNPKRLTIARAKMWCSLHHPFAAQAAVKVQTSTAPSHRDHILARCYAEIYGLGVVKEERRKAYVMQWQALHGKHHATYALYAHIGGRKKIFGAIDGQKYNYIHAHGAWMKDGLNFSLMASAEKEVLKRHAEAWDFLFGLNIKTYGRQGVVGSSIASHNLIGRINECDDQAAKKALACMEKNSNEKKALSAVSHQLLDSWVRVHEHDRLSYARASQWERNHMTHITADRYPGESGAVSAALNVIESLEIEPLATSSRLDLECWLKQNKEEVDTFLAKRRNARVQNLRNFFNDIPTNIARHAVSLIPLKVQDEFKDWLERGRRTMRSSPGKNELLAILAWSEDNKSYIEREAMSTRKMDGPENHHATMDKGQLQGQNTNIHIKNRISSTALRSSYLKHRGRWHFKMGKESTQKEATTAVASTST